MRLLAIVCCSCLLVNATSSVASRPPARTKAIDGCASGIEGPSLHTRSQPPKTWLLDLGAGLRVEMVLVPAGSFQMGDDAYDNERPVHQVTITKPYFIGKYEVTQGLWKAVMGDTPSQFTGHDDLPVEQVSWDDCKEFIKRLNAKTKLQFRLPTEAEWEYACRAGTTGDFAGTLDPMAWYYGNAGRAWLSDASYEYDKGTANGNRTHRVGLKKPNSWGLFDMHGNVGEWCEDWYDESYYARGAAKDPRGPALGTASDDMRVSRGGAYSLEAARCRSAFRTAGTPYNQLPDLGFRLVRTQ